MRSIKRNVYIIQCVTISYIFESFAIKIIPYLKLISMIKCTCICIRYLNVHFSRSFFSSPPLLSTFYPSRSNPSFGIVFKHWFIYQSTDPPIIEGEKKSGFVRSKCNAHHPPSLTPLSSPPRWITVSSKRQLVKFVQRSRISVNIPIGRGGEGGRVEGRNDADRIRNFSPRCDEPCPDFLSTGFRLDPANFPYYYLRVLNRLD